MIKTYLLLQLTLLWMFASAQKNDPAVNLKKIEKKIITEGVNLYQLDMAATIGVKIYSHDFPDLVENTMGYFSYKEGSFYKCVFYNKLAEPQILSTISFDSLFNMKRVAVNTTLRPMNFLEKDLYNMRERTIDDIKRDTTFYKLYNYTSITLIPVINAENKRVYILTKSDDSTTVIFGNDYQIDFDNANYISSRKLLHNEFVIIEAASKDPYIEEDPAKIMHVHNNESGEFMTPTDVCILLLYQKKNRWDHHVVMAQNYVSIWYCDNNELETVTKKKWLKYNKPEKETKEKEKNVVGTNKE